MSRQREGFTMVEVLVAMVLLAIILTTLAGFTFTTAQRNMTVADSNTREAIKLATMNRYNAVPFDTLVAVGSTQARCDIVAYADRNRYERCVRVSLASNNSRATVWIIVRPLQRGVPADSTRFARPGPLPPSPLCTTGSC
jgi:prepilin-type N-terminal cleavage/methylation domain-containing protein